MVSSGGCGRGEAAAGGAAPGHLNATIRFISILMKGVACCTLAAAAALVTLADARPMHAGINYARYLEEKDTVADELDAWMSKYKTDAQANGWLPQAESRDADEVAEDRKQRFFMAKELVAELKEKNPDAEFSVDSPFSLMTTDEFAKYVANSYIGSGAEAASRRRVLRSETFDWEPVVETREAKASDQAGNAKVKATDLNSLFDELFKKNGQAAAGSDARTWNFQGMVDNLRKVNWLSMFGWHHKKPATEAPTLAPTAAPTAAPTSAPTPPPETPAPETSTPQTAAPEEATLAPEPAPEPAPVPEPAPEPAPVPEPVEPEAQADADVLPAPEPAPEYVPEPAPEYAPEPAPEPAPAPVPAPEPAPVPAPATNENAVIDEEIGADAGSVDWSTSGCMPPIQNQGQCGSCWSFATIAAVESTKCIVHGTGSYTKLSEQNIASCSTRNYGCNGGVPVWAMQYIMENGVCTEQDDPYTSSNNVLAGCNSGCAKQNPGVTGIGRVEDEAGLIGAVTRNPVIVAVASGNSAWKQYKGGVMSYCETDNVDHAVVVVGYDASTLKIRNSWGTQWGENGYVRLQRSTAGKGTCNVLQDMTYVKF